MRCQFAKDLSFILEIIRHSRFFSWSERKFEVDLCAVLARIPFSEILDEHIPGYTFPKQSAFYRNKFGTVWIFTWHLSQARQAKCKNVLSDIFGDCRIGYFEHKKFWSITYKMVRQNSNCTYIPNKEMYTFLWTLLYDPQNSFLVAPKFHVTFSCTRPFNFILYRKIIFYSNKKRRTGNGNFLD